MTVPLLPPLPELPPCTCGGRHPATYSGHDPACPRSEWARLARARAELADEWERETQRTDTVRVAGHPHHRDDVPLRREA